MTFKAIRSTVGARGSLKNLVAAEYISTMMYCLDAKILKFCPS